MSDKDTKLYAVIGASGLGQDRHEWIAGVFTSQPEAIALAESKRREAMAYAANYELWCQAARKLRIRDAIYIDEQKRLDDQRRAESVLGPMPTGEEADDYTVYQGCLNVWSRWEVVKDE